MAVGAAVVVANDAAVVAPEEDEEDDDDEEDEEDEEDASGSGGRGMAGNAEKDTNEEEEAISTFTCRLLLRVPPAPFASLDNSFLLLRLSYMVLAARALLTTRSFNIALSVSICFEIRSNSCSIQLS